ncbi:MAG: prepilin peptidase [Campylobacteraceae bacterium]|jgi:leader peptidase (prepilin peptidase)/N-methyltransferase|nr:prepilin peptidase [Campylobacteraceae bacterium]
MIVAYLSILGLLIGSFLNVLILRIPKGESVVFPSSHCTACGEKLKWYHNIPLLSWIFLRGKCAFCGDKISVQYPLIELATALIFFVCALKESEIYVALSLSLVFSLLLALSLIDIRYKAVPDSLSLPALALALVHFEVLSRFEYALLFAGGFALLRIVISSLLKKEAMGEADIIIAAIIGAVLGLQLGLIAIYLSAVFAIPVFLIVAKRGFEMPFIPFLAIGLFVTYLLDKQFLTLVRYIYG